MNSHLRIFCRLLTGAVTLSLVGCVTTQETANPGALPRSGPDVTPQLNAATYMTHGHLLERQGSYNKAAEQYQKVLEVNPKSVEARTRLGITYNKLKQHAEASDQFRRALELSPRNASLLNNLGFSLYLEGKLEHAEAVLTEALAVAPEFRRARMNHAVVLAKLGRYAEALDEFRLAGTEADAYFNLAVIQTEAGLYADAAHSLEEALRLDPDFADARDQLRRVSRLAAAQELADQAALVDAAIAGTELPQDETITDEDAAVAFGRIRSSLMKATGADLRFVSHNEVASALGAWFNEKAQWARRAATELYLSNTAPDRDDEARWSTTDKKTPLLTQQ